MTCRYERIGLSEVGARVRPQIRQFIVADDNLCVSLVKEFPYLPNQTDLTFEIRRKGLVIGDADQNIEADFFEHELTLGKELAGEVLEQVGLNLLASEPETSELVGIQVF